MAIPTEAETVLRAFQRYGAGSSLKTICAPFDAEEVPVSSATWKRRNRTGSWNPSSLSSNIERGEGILNNCAYIGEQVFNRRN